MDKEILRLNLAMIEGELIDAQATVLRLERRKKRITKQL